jgi:TonB-dependent SusC/RagA subfamily outer membrane receptor
VIAASSIAFLTALFVAMPAAGQETGTVRGRVVEAGSGRPLSSVQISVAGTGIGAVADAAGEFSLANVPSGEATVEARMLGFGTQTESITVPAGGVVEIAFTMREAAINMDEIVVTGTAAATERRKIGNTLASIDARAIADQAPISGVDELLKGRASGVNVLPSSGQVGTGGAVRIRGMVSISQDNTPLIYVDGVRVDKSASGPGVGGQGSSRILDLVPTDIERIEVVKGAAATTLYGTEASAGVIQIFTKRGEAGAPRWDFQVEQGVERIADVFKSDLNSNFVGPTGFRARAPNELIETGYSTAVGGSMSAGTEAVRYYISGRYSTQEGSVTPTLNNLRQIATRFNLNAVANPNLSFEVSAGVLNSRLRLPENDNGIFGVMTNLLLGVPYQATEDRPWGEAFNSHEANNQLENLQQLNHFTGGFTMRFQPRDFLSTHLTVGLDLVNEENTKFFPFGFLGSTHNAGRKDNETRTNRALTVDLRLAMSNQIFSEVSSELALGLQGNFDKLVRVFAQGLDFPAPGVSTVGAGARTFGNETRTEEVTAGFFVQETIGLKDQLFLTGGLRVDGNSAFGGEFTSQAYPKVSVAYNISDAGFWPADLVPTLKLRAAYGTSGLAPAQFAADRTFMPVSALEGQPAVSPANLGDPNLGPERSTELELGFDAGFLDDRVSLVMTYFRQRTKDALLPAQFSPTQGFEQPQLKNIGEIENSGLETELRAVMVSRRNLELESALQFTIPRNKVLDMGGSPPILPAAASAIQVREGYPILGMWTFPLLGWDEERRVHLVGDTVEYVGQAMPKFYGSYSLNIRLFQNLMLSGLTDWATGHHQTNGTRYFRIRYRTGDEYLSLVNDDRGTRTPAADSLYDLMIKRTYGGVTEKADWLKLREISATYTIPSSWVAGLGMRDMRVRFAARNLFTFTDYTGVDPEVNWSGTHNLIRGVEFFTVPQPRRFYVSANVSF